MSEALARWIIGGEAIAIVALAVTLWKMVQARDRERLVAIEKAEHILAKLQGFHETKHE